MRMADRRASPPRAHSFVSRVHQDEIDDMSAASSLILTDQHAVGQLLPPFDSPIEGVEGGILSEGSAVWSVVDDASGDERLCLHNGTSRLNIALMSIRIPQNSARVKVTAVCDLSASSKPLLAVATNQGSVSALHVVDFAAATLLAQFALHELAVSLLHAPLSYSDLRLPVLVGCASGRVLLVDAGGDPSTQPLPHMDLTALSPLNGSPLSESPTVSNNTNPYARAVTALAVDPIRGLVLAADARGFVRVWSLPLRALVASFPANVNAPITHLALVASSSHTLVLAAASAALNESLERLLNIVTSLEAALTLWDLTLSEPQSLIPKSQRTLDDNISNNSQSSKSLGVSLVTQRAQRSLEASSAALVSVHGLQALLLRDGTPIICVSWQRRVNNKLPEWHLEIAPVHVSSSSSLKWQRYHLSHTTLGGESADLVQVNLLPRTITMDKASTFEENHLDEDGSDPHKRSLSMSFDCVIFANPTLATLRFESDPTKLFRQLLQIGSVALDSESISRVHSVLDSAGLLGLDAALASLHRPDPNPKTISTQQSHAVFASVLFHGRVTLLAQLAERYSRPETRGHLLSLLQWGVETSRALLLLAQGLAPEISDSETLRRHRAYALVELTRARLNDLLALLGSVPLDSEEDAAVVKVRAEIEEVTVEIGQVLIEIDVALWLAERADLGPRFEAAQAQLRAKARNRRETFHALHAKVNSVALGAYSIDISTMKITHVHKTPNNSEPALLIDALLAPSSYPPLTLPALVLDASNSAARVHVSPIAHAHVALIYALLDLESLKLPRSALSSWTSVLQHAPAVAAFVTHFLVAPQHAHLAHALWTCDSAVDSRSHKDTHVDKRSHKETIHVDTMEVEEAALSDALVQVQRSSASWSVWGERLVRSAAALGFLKLAVTLLRIFPAPETRSELLFRVTALCNAAHYREAWTAQRQYRPTPITDSDSESTRHLALFGIFNSAFDKDSEVHVGLRRSFAMRLLQTPLNADEERALEAYLKSEDTCNDALHVAFLVPRRRYVDAVHVLSNRNSDGVGSAALLKDLRLLLTPQEKNALVAAAKSSSQAQGLTPTSVVLTAPRTPMAPRSVPAISTPKTPMTAPPAVPIEEDNDAMDIDSAPQTEAQPLGTPMKPNLQQSPFQKAAASRQNRLQGVPRSASISLIPGPTATSAPARRTPVAPSPAAKTLISALLTPARGPSTQTPSKELPPTPSIASPMRSALASPLRSTIITSPGKPQVSERIRSPSPAPKRSLLTRFMGDLPSAPPPRDPSIDIASSLGSSSLSSPEGSPQPSPDRSSQSPPRSVSPQRSPSPSRPALPLALSLSDDMDEEEKSEDQIQVPQLPQGEDLSAEPMALEEKELEPLSDLRPMSEPEAEPTVTNPFAPPAPMEESKEAEVDSDLKSHEDELRVHEDKMDETLNQVAPTPGTIKRRGRPPKARPSETLTLNPPSSPAKNSPSMALRTRRRTIQPPPNVAPSTPSSSAPATPSKNTRAQQRLAQAQVTRASQTPSKTQSPKSKPQTQASKPTAPTRRQAPQQGARLLPKRGRKEEPEPEAPSSIASPSKEEAPTAPRRVQRKKAKELEEEVPTPTLIKSDAPQMEEEAVVQAPTPARRGRPPKRPREDDSNINLDSEQEKEKEKEKEKEESIVQFVASPSKSEATPERRVRPKREATRAPAPKSPVEKKAAEKPSKGTNPKEGSKEESAPAPVTPPRRSAARNANAKAKAKAKESDQSASSATSTPRRSSRLGPGGKKQ